MKTEEPTSKELEDTAAVPGETWKCMGCGKLISVNEERCSCGYKR